jgi:tRNA (guanine26-N2/guanine27-N2)-dimethyltransferase
LNNAIVRLSRSGILAVTATDTSALSGTYENACKRKYWAKPLRNELKHEIGLRILIRKIQLVAAQHDKALTPIFSYSKDHYMRVFFSCEKGKEKVDSIIKQLGEAFKVGPMWLGNLWDENIVDKMFKKSKEKKFEKSVVDLLDLINKEARIPCVGFFDIHTICKKEKLSVPKYDSLISAIENEGFKVSRTHFSDKGLKSDIESFKLISLIKKELKKN